MRLSVASAEDADARNVVGLGLVEECEAKQLVDVARLQRVGSLAALILEPYVQLLTPFRHSNLDPSSGGSHALLLRAATSCIRPTAGHDLFWTVLAGHEHSAADYGTLSGDYGTLSGDYRWIIASAS
jgi:hypothetical protein